MAIKLESDVKSPSEPLTFLNLFLSAFTQLIYNLVYNVLRRE